MLAIVPFIPVPATSSYTNTLAVLHHLKFMDESSVNTSMTRLYGSHPSRGGRAAPHLRVIDKVPRLSGPNTTTLAVLGLEGIVAPLVIKGAVNGATFYGYIEQCVAPKLVPGDVLFIDNLSAHKVAGIADLVKARGARLVFLPPYSPDLNPKVALRGAIELAWSKVKTILRRLKARTDDVLLEALKTALLAITPQDIVNWFAHCGYAVN